MNWIYLKSKQPADALALATVISYSSDTFCIVRRTSNSFFFRGLKNVIIDYYPNSEEDNLLVVDGINSDSWQTICHILSEKLNINTPSVCQPYLGFVAINDSVIKQWGDAKSILLYLFPDSDRRLDLMLIDQLVRLLEQKGLKSVDGGTIVLPCIKGTKDLRQIISLPVLFSLKNKIEFIITTDYSLKPIGEALGITVFTISFVSGFAIDELVVKDADQMANYIIMNNKLK